MGSPFMDAERTELPWTWHRTLDQVLGLVATYSIFSTGSSELRHRITGSATTLLGEMGGNDELYGLPMATRCWKAARV
jgi:hypothetical protein